jgi:hypothetical protein
MKRVGVVLVIVLSALMLGCIEKEKPSLPSNSSVNATILKINDHYKLFVSITLPNPCHKIVYRGFKVYQNEIYIDFQYTPPQSNACVQVTDVYGKMFDLGNFSKGDYEIYIRINGKTAKTLKFKIE